jgi:hypothetical protein
LRNSRFPCCADVGTVIKFPTTTNFFPLMFTNNFFVYSDAAVFLHKCVCVCVCVCVGVGVSCTSQSETKQRVFKRDVLGNREAGGLLTAQLDSTQTERQ